MAEHFGDRIRIEWKSFLLRHDTKVPERTKFVDYTQNWRTMAEMEPRATFMPWASDDDPPSSSLPALVAAKVVEGAYPDRVDAFHRRLFTAYFSENRTISSWPVLRDLAIDVGIPGDEFDTLVAEQRPSLAQLVIDEHNDAIGQGITAVPTVVINGVLPVPGAQESATYINWIERIIERS